MTSYERAYKGELGYLGDLTREFLNKSTKPALGSDPSDLLHYSLYPHESPVEHVDEEDCKPRKGVVEVSWVHSYKVRYLDIGPLVEHVDHDGILYSVY